MYIVAIAWLYVAILMAATEATLVAGLLTLLFYGVAPLALFLWLFGTPRRRHRQRLAENASSEAPVESTDGPAEDKKS